MESVEMTAKTVEEAVELALRQLEANREEVEVNVLSRGRSGVLGIGAEPARVRVTRLASGERVASTAMEIIQRLLSLMQVEAAPTIRSAGGDKDAPPIIDIQGNDSGLLIGRQGETLRSFQFVVNLLLGRRLQERAHVAIDVEQYRERRYASLRQMALRAAERVASTGRPITLEPMSAAERRVVHLALADHPHVVTESEGAGDSRRVTVTPRQR